MATIPVAKLGVKLNIGDPNIVIFEDDVLTGLVYRSGNEIKTIDGTVRVIHATTKANSASPDECPPEPYVHRYITPTAFVIDSSEQYDAELTKINISSIISIGQVNGVGDFAKVGDTTYDNVNAAVADAADGATVLLTQDAVLTTPLAPNAITLDGNEKTLMFQTESAFLDVFHLVEFGNGIISVLESAQDGFLIGIRGTFEGCPFGFQSGPVFSHGKDRLSQQAGNEVVG